MLYFPIERYCAAFHQPSPNLEGFFISARWQRNESKTHFRDIARGCEVEAPSDGKTFLIFLSKKKTIFKAKVIFKSTTDCKEIPMY